MTACILVVDDDPPAARRLLRNIHELTSMMVLIAENLRQAASFVADQSLNIVALITDLFFREETVDDQHSLFDGVDLIVFSKARRASMYVFVVSAYATEPTMVEKIVASDVAIDGIFEKFSSSIENLNTSLSACLNIPQRYVVSANEGIMIYDIFMAHNSQDKVEVENICRLLKGHGFEVWLDDTHIRPGHLFQEEIEKMLPLTRAIGVCIGDKGVGPWERLEIRTAISQFVARDAPVIPIVLKSCTSMPIMPAMLAEFRAVRFGKSRRVDDPIRQIIWGITGHRPK